MLHLVPPPIGAVASTATTARTDETALMSAARRLERAKAALTWAEAASKRSGRRDHEAEVLAACDEVLHARAAFLRLLSRQGLSVGTVTDRCEVDEAIAD